MFAKILGYLAVLFGILWVIWPILLRNYFARKTNWTLFWVALALLFYPMVHLGKQWGVVGIICVFIAFWIVMKMAHERIRHYFTYLPLIAFRVVGVLNIVSGCLLIFTSKK